jgi:hypothetical protein
MTRDAWAGLVALCFIIFTTAGTVSSFFTPTVSMPHGTQVTLILLSVGLCCGFWFEGFRYGRGK